VVSLRHNGAAGRQLPQMRRRHRFRRPTSFDPSRSGASRSLSFRHDLLAKSGSPTGVRRSPGGRQRSRHSSERRLNATVISASCQRSEWSGRRSMARSAGIRRPRWRAYPTGTGLRCPSPPGAPDGQRHALVRSHATHFHLGPDVLSLSSDQAERRIECKREARNCLPAERYALLRVIYDQLGG
jgi:hypothetical protein